MAKVGTGKAFAAEGRLLAAALDAKSIGPSAFSKMLEQAYGLRAGPQNVQNWRNGRGFNEKNRKLCAALLGLPADAFEAEPPAAATSAPQAKHPALAALLSERKLRRFTLEALRALEAIHQADPGEHYWRTQADVHEGIAASLEAARFRPVAGARKSPKANRH